MAATPEMTPAAVEVAFIADRYLRYPGETVTLDIYVNTHQDIDELAIRVSVPEKTSLRKDISPLFRAAGIEEEQVNLSIFEEDSVTLVNWAVGDPISGGTAIKCSISLKISPDIENNTPLISLAGAGYLINGEEFETGEAISININSQARYLTHMPSIYRDDEVMNRLLMFFESFWEPIESQVEGLPNYFDPLLTPPDFLPWLAAWMDITLNQRWPEESQRKLILNAYKLYRKRGTRQGLAEILEIFTGGEPSINEHLANNFILGQNSMLGRGIALGKHNLQNTFTVNLHLPPAEGVSEEEIKEKEAQRTRHIKTIIENEKPAFTGYTLEIDTIPFST
jgi:phage tail-like protein